MGRLKAPQRRQQLIEVATKLFAEYGYDATTTASIAEAAGVTEPILYRHFKSEQTLRHWHDLIAGTDDPMEQLRRIAREFPEHIHSLADAYHVLHNALTT